MVKEYRVIVTCVLVASCVFLSCKRQGEVIKERLITVDIYSDERGNSRVASDFVRLGWEKVFEDSLPEYFENHYSEKSLIRTPLTLTGRIDTNVQWIGTVCNYWTDDCVALNKLVLNTYKEFENLYLANHKIYQASEKFISKARSLANDHVTLLDEGKIEDFLEILPTEKKARKRKALEFYRKERKMKYWKRTDSIRKMGIVSQSDSNLINWIEIQITYRRRKKSEYPDYNAYTDRDSDRHNYRSQSHSHYFRYQEIDGKVVLNDFSNSILNEYWSSDSVKDLTIISTRHDY